MIHKFQAKTDCFAFRDEKGGPGCSALNGMLCVTTGQCPFYVEHEEAKERAQRARLAAMDKGYYLDSGKYSPLTQTAI